MYINSGYLNNSRIDFKDKSRPLIVGSAGNYRLKTRKRLPTWRPRGRVDYQLLYIAAGKTWFYFDGNEKDPTEVTAGHMVLYRPGQEQHYVYYGEDQPEVFWVHFTGSNVTNILRRYHFPEDHHVLYCGLLQDYRWIYNQMILELQLAQPDSPDLLVHLLYHIFLLVNRQAARNKSHVSNAMLEETEEAIRFFQAHYREPIRIDEYAKSIHVSESWFLQKFKEHTGVTPMHYILSLRMSAAQDLLENSDYSVTEIAEIIGYDNPLYFSRIFRKQIGVSPREYRKLQTSSGENPA